MLKKTSFIVFLLIAMLASGCSIFHKPFSLMPEHTLANFYELDVKSKYIEKFDAMGVKYGAISYLKMQKYCDVVEVCEKYSVWIKDLKRDANDPENVTISFNLELQEPSAVFEGMVYKKQHFSISYDMSDINYPTDSDSWVVASCFKQYAERCRTAKNITAFVNNRFVANAPLPYTTLASNVINFILNKFPNEQTLKYQQVEAVICGAEIQGRINEWLWEMEQK